MRFLNDKQRKAVFANMGRNQFTLIGRPGTWVSRSSHRRKKAAEKAAKELSQTVSKSLKDYFPKPEYSKGWSESKKKAWAARKAMQAGDYGAAGFTRVTTTRAGDPSRVLRGWEKGKGWVKAGIFAPLKSDDAALPYFSPESMQAWHKGLVSSPGKYRPLLDQLQKERAAKFRSGAIKSIFERGIIPRTVEYPTKIVENLDTLLKPEDIFSGEQLTKFKEELGGRDLSSYVSEFMGLTPEEARLINVELTHGDVGLAAAALAGGKQTWGTEKSLQKFVGDVGVAELRAIGYDIPFNSEGAVKDLFAETIKKEGRSPNKYEVAAVIERTKDAVKPLKPPEPLGEPYRPAKSFFGMTSAIGMDPDKALDFAEGFGILPEGATKDQLGQAMVVRAAQEELLYGDKISMPAEIRSTTEKVKSYLKEQGFGPYETGGYAELGAASAIFQQQPAGQQDFWGAYGPPSAPDLAPLPPAGPAKDTALSPWLLPAAAGGAGLILAGSVGKSRHVKRKPKEKEEEKKK